MLLNLLAVDFDMNLAIASLFLGLLVSIGIEIRGKTTRERQVLILDYRRHHFGHAVARGVRSVLDHDRRQWRHTYRSTGSTGVDGATEWQILEIDQAIFDDVDALVLVPASDDVLLWRRVAAAIKQGVFVVVVDTKAPNWVFREVGIEPPAFVSSEYNQTGLLVGKILVDWLSADSSRECVLWIGPDGSWPGEERSRNVMYELTKASLLDRAELVPLDTWEAEPTRLSRTVDFIEECGNEVAIYCADDENALALHLYTLMENARLRQQMFIIGCNGTPDDWGGVPVIDQRAADATIDILAEQLGASAAMVLVKERTGRLQPSERSVYVKPRILIRGADQPAPHPPSDRDDEADISHEAASAMDGSWQRWNPWTDRDEASLEGHGSPSENGGPLA